MIHRIQVMAAERFPKSLTLTHTVEWGYSWSHRDAVSDWALHSTSGLPHQEVPYLCWLCHGWLWQSLCGGDSSQDCHSHQHWGIVYQLQVYIQITALTTFLKCEPQSASQSITVLYVQYILDVQHLWKCIIIIVHRYSVKSCPISVYRSSTCTPLLGPHRECWWGAGLNWSSVRQECAQYHEQCGPTL